MKKRIMVFCDFYLPGYKSGGGMLSVLNLVDRFADRYDFFVVTRNYESKGDRTPYTTVTTGAWNAVGNASVFYLSNDNYSLKTFTGLVNEIMPDAVFLNSAFSRPVVRFLTARRKKLIKDIPVILAPCGEMSRGALTIKPLKKKAFIAYAKAVGLYRGVIWKASFEHEKEDIRRVFSSGPEIMLAPDLAPKEILPGHQFADKPVKEAGSVKLLMLSRITKMKNFHYLIDVLSNVEGVKVDLEILGPVEDVEYWEQCQAKVRSLPPNITVHADTNFLPRETALRRMADAHFFVLPTLGENFGYVMIEALAAGCALVISDRTVWNDINNKNAGWTLPLDKPELWASTLKECAAMDAEKYREMSVEARSYAEEWLADTTDENAVEAVIERALGKGRPRISDGERNG